MTVSQNGDDVPYKPQRWLSFEGLVVVMNAVGSVFIVVIMAMICVDIVSRFVFGNPISGVTELTEIIIVGVVFLQLAHATRLGKLTRSDAAYGLLARRSPRAGHLLGMVYDLASAFLLGVIAWGTVPKLQAAVEFDYYVGNVGVFVFPEWPIWALVIVGSTIITIQFLLLAIRHAKNVITGQREDIQTGGH